MSDSEPLISPALLTKLVVGAAALALITVGINFSGKWYGRKIASGSFTASTEIRNIFIGPDHLRLPENVIRFPEQRVDGELEQVNLVLLWPSLHGYNNENSLQFNSLAPDTGLIFVELSQSTMTRDMSGRVEPIYSRLFAPETEKGPGGLLLHHFREGSGYGDEVFLTDPGGGAAPYAVRCIKPSSPQLSTSADCQRDVHTGEDLNLEYRFSYSLLPHWKALDAAMLKFVSDHLVRQSGAS